MPANTSPIYGLTPLAPSVRLTAASAKSDGSGTIGTDIFLVLTAGANGTRIGRIRLMPTSSAAATATTATVARVFFSTQSSGATTNSNTFLVAEVQLASQSAANSTTPVVPVDVVLETPIPSGVSVLVSTHAAPAANTAWVATAMGSTSY